MAFEEYANG